MGSPNGGVPIDREKAQRAWDQAIDNGKVIQGPPDECWAWVGSLTDDGYGRVYCDGSSKKSHRVAYTALVGPIPAGMALDHLCRNRACCNPWHLDPVPNRTNVLRGESVVAKHAAKTECVRGHPFDEANTGKYRTGGRACRECQKQRRSRRNAAITQAAHALGLTQQQYIALHGGGTRTAEALVQSLEGGEQGE